MHELLPVEVDRLQLLESFGHRRSLLIDGEVRHSSNLLPDDPGWPESAEVLLVAFSSELVRVECALPELTTGRE